MACPTNPHLVCGREGVGGGVEDLGGGRGGQIDPRPATDDENVTTDVGNNEGRVVFSVATTFPWKD